MCQLASPQAVCWPGVCDLRSHNLWGAQLFHIWLEPVVEVEVEVHSNSVILKVPKAKITGIFSAWVTLTVWIVPSCSWLCACPVACLTLPVGCSNWLPWLPECTLVLVYPASHAQGLFASQPRSHCSDFDWRCSCAGKSLASVMWQIALRSILDLLFALCSKASF